MDGGEAMWFVCVTISSTTSGSGKPVQDAQLFWDEIATVSNQNLCRPSATIAL